MDREFTDKEADECSRTRQHFLKNTQNILDNHKITNNKDNERLH